MSTVQKRVVQLEVRRVDPDLRIIEGIASTPTPDRMGDVVEPLGAQFRLPLPLLLGHDHAQPVGRVEHAEATRQGVKFRATMPRIDEAGVLRDRVEEAWQSVKAGLITSVSIGFRTLDGEPIGRTGGMRFTSWEWLELSLVAVPAQPDAVITGVHGKAHTQQREDIRDTITKRVGEVMSDAMKADRTLQKFTAGTFAGLARAIGATGAILLARIEHLERRLEAAEKSALGVYRGVFQSGESYQAGQFVTCKSSLWCATRDTDARPGTDDSWRLSAKGERQ